MTMTMNQALICIALGLRQPEQPGKRKARGPTVGSGPFFISRARLLQIPSAFTLSHERTGLGRGRGKFLLEIAHAKLMFTPHPREVVERENQDPRHKDKNPDPEDGKSQRTRRELLVERHRPQKNENQRQQRRHKQEISPEAEGDRTNPS